MYGDSMNRISSKVLKSVEDTRTKYLKDRNSSQGFLLDQRHECIFISFVKWMFDNSIQSIRDDVLKNLGYVYSIGYAACARKRAGKGWEGDIISFASKQCNIEHFHAALVTGALLDVTPEQCFTAFPSKDADKSDDIVTSSKVFTSMPDVLPTAYGDYNLKYIDYQYDYRGHKWQAICVYSADEQNFAYLFATRTARNYKLVMQIGVAKAEARILSEEVIRRENESHVIFCIALPVALHLRRLIRDEGFSENGYVVSGYSDSHGSPPLSSLRNRAVTIVPDFTRAGFIGAGDFAKKICDIGATQVTIYPFPIVADGIPASTYMAGVGSPWKASLFEQAIRLTEVKDVPATVQEIVNRALTLRAWQNHLIKWGLTAAEHDAISQVQGDLPFMNLAERVGKVTAVDLNTKPSLNALIQAGYILFIWGNSNSGKSRVILQIITALTTGTSAFCFAGTERPRKVLLLDGELTEAELQARIQQITGSHLSQELKANFNYFLARESGSCNLLLPEIQKYILEKIRDNKLEVLVIDPLTCFCPDVSEASITNLFQFFYTVEKHCGTAVVFTHHAKKDGKNFKGATDLKNKSQTVIHIEGYKDLLNAQDTSDAVKAALTNGGDAVVRLNFEECKVPSTLNGQHVVYHLPKQGTWRYIEGTACDVASGTDTSFFTPSESVGQKVDALGYIQVNDEPVDTLGNATQPSLNKKQRKLYQFFQENPDKKITRQDVEKILETGEDGAGNALKALKNKNLIRAIGSGKNICYVLKALPQTDSHTFLP